MLSPRMLIMDKFTLVAEALKRLIETNLRVEVIGTVNDSDSLFAAAKASKPEIVLLSVYRPFEGELKIGRLMKDVYPSARIIVLTTNDDAKTAAECVNHWASAYLHLTTTADLLEAVRVVIRGERFLAPEFHCGLAQAFDERYSVGSVLTARQSVQGPSHSISTKRWPVSARSLTLPFSTSPSITTSLRSSLT